MNTQPDLLDRIVHLEEVFAHHDQLVQQLNQVVVELREEVDGLSRKCQEQLGRIECLVQNQATEPRSLEDDKPPHY
jgi:uncharacterized coiled-coil protein SlyX